MREVIDFLFYLASGLWLEEQWHHSRQARWQLATLGLILSLRFPWAVISLSLLFILASPAFLLVFLFLDKDDVLRAQVVFLLIWVAVISFCILLLPALPEAPW